MATNGNQISILGEHIEQYLDYRNYSDLDGKMTRRYKADSMMMALVRGEGLEPSSLIPGNGF